MSNPRVYFDITIGGAPAGRIVMELFADKTPKVSTPLSESSSLLFSARDFGNLNQPLTFTNRLPRTSALSAPARRALAAPASPSTTRAPASTVSSPSSCFRVVTSPAATYGNTTILL